MITKEQSVAVADALLAPGHDILEASREQRETAKRKAEAQRRVAKYGAIGFFLGGLVAYVLSANVFAFALIGLTLGIVAGRIFLGRPHI